MEGKTQPAVLEIWLFEAADIFDLLVARETPLGALLWDIFTTLACERVGLQAIGYEDLKRLQARFAAAIEAEPVGTGQRNPALP